MIRNLILILKLIILLSLSSLPAWGEDTVQMYDANIVMLRNAIENKVTDTGKWLIVYEQSIPDVGWHMPCFRYELKHTLIEVGKEAAKKFLLKLKNNGCVGGCINDIKLFYIDGEGHVKETKFEYSNIVTIK